MANKAISITVSGRDRYHLLKSINRQQYMQLFMSALLNAGNYRKIRKRLYDNLSTAIYVSPGSIEHTLVEYRNYLARQEKLPFSKEEMLQALSGAKGIANNIYKTLFRITPTSKTLEKNKEFMIIKHTGDFSSLLKQWRESINNLKDSIPVKSTKTFLNMVQGGHIVGVVSDLAQQSMFSSKTAGKDSFLDEKLQKEFEELTTKFMQEIATKPSLVEELNLVISIEWDADFLHNIEKAFKIQGLSRSKSFKEWKTRVPIALEVDIINQGRSATLTNLRDWFLNEFIKDLETNNRISRALLDALEQLSVSNPNSLEEQMRELEDLWIDTEYKGKKYTKALKGVIQEQEKVKLKAGGVPPVLKGDKAGGQSLSSIQNYINANMHRILRDKVMGKGGAKELLNYRTGRFAHSAQVISMRSITGKTVEATVDWMHFPYDVFAPGGRLHRPLRDPRVLIHGAVREAFKELAISQLRLKTRVT